jgi:hypothetical protein
MNDTRRAALRVDELSGPRWSLGIEAIADGHSVLLAGEILLYLSSNSEILTCEILTSGALPAHGSRAAQALDEKVRRAGILIDTLTKDDPKFSELIASHETRFDVVDDYGNGAVDLARNIDPATWSVSDQPG